MRCSQDGTGWVMHQRRRQHGAGNRWTDGRQGGNMLATLSRCNARILKQLTDKATMAT